MGGKQLSKGRMNLCRRDKSSSKKLLEQPWVVQMFNKINVDDNFEHLAPMYNGQHALLRSSTLGILVSLYMDHLPSHLAFHAYLMCRQCQLTLFDHIPCSQIGILHYPDGVHNPTLPLFGVLLLHHPTLHMFDGHHGPRPPQFEWWCQRHKDHWQPH